MCRFRAIAAFRTMTMTTNNNIKSRSAGIKAAELVHLFR
jgi:hypothetical protein